VFASPLKDNSAPAVSIPDSAIKTLSATAPDHGAAKKKDIFQNQWRSSMR
jgi:hypothetical protein